MIVFRGRHGDIVFEFLPPSTSHSKGAMVLCDGIPSVPKQEKLMELLAGKGLFVVFPRYRGTWESAGRFLAGSPIEDIKSVVSLIGSGAVTELYAERKFKVGTDSVFIAGTSFGGAVALALADDPEVSKVVAFSPVLNFGTHNEDGNEQDLKWLGTFVGDAFGEGYRFAQGDWDAMVRGELFNAPDEIVPDRTKDVLIVYDRGDSEVNATKIEAYAERNKVKTFQVSDTGHLSFSKVPPELWDRVCTWLGT